MIGPSHHLRAAPATAILRSLPEDALKSFAQAIDLADDPLAIDAYRRLHQTVWPEVLAALRAIGIQRMKIWIAGNRLFMWFEASDEFDPQRDFQRYAADDRCRAWDEWMRTFQRQLPDPTPGNWWTPMDEVFDLERANASLP